MRPDPLAKGSCNNPFLQSDGYCTKCGQNHLQGRKKRGKASALAAWSNHVNKVVETPPAVRATQKPAPATRPRPVPQPTIAQSAIMKKAIETVELMAEVYEVEIDVVVNTHRKGGRTKINGIGKFTKYTIEFSPKTCRWFHDNGYTSYRVGCTDTAKRTLGRLAKGTDAVQVHALHEVAHVLVDKDGYDWEGRQHGSYFLQKFADLLNIAM